jgi:hypothetical protein
LHARRLVPARKTAGYNGRPALLAQLVEHLHGKEGVSGSSPEEGLTNAGSPLRSLPTNKPFVRVVLGVASILALPAIAMLITDEVVWSLADFVLAGALLTVIAAGLELSARKAGSLALATGIAVLGVAAGLLGEADDAPGLVLLGLLLIATAFALGVRRAAGR